MGFLGLGKSKFEKVSDELKRLEAESRDLESLRKNKRETTDYLRRQYEAQKTDENLKNLDAAEDELLKIDIQIKEFNERIANLHQWLMKVERKKK